MLTEVAEAHQRGQQQSQRQSHRDKGDGSVEKQLRQDTPFQAFAHQIIDIQPQKLHDEDENHDEERENERADERLGNI